MKTDSIKYKEKYPSGKISKKDTTALTIRPETPAEPGAPSSPSEERKITINKRWLHYVKMLSCWGHIGHRYTCLLEPSFILLSLVIMCFTSQLRTVTNLVEADLIYPTATLGSILFKPRAQQRFGKTASSVALASSICLSIARGWMQPKWKFPNSLWREAVGNRPGGGSKR